LLVMPVVVREGIIVVPFGVARHGPWQEKNWLLHPAAQVAAVLVRPLGAGVVGVEAVCATNLAGLAVKLASVIAAISAAAARARIGFSRSIFSRLRQVSKTHHPTSNATALLIVPGRDDQRWRSRLR
jgi:hypothetical protein